MKSIDQDFSSIDLPNPKVYTDSVASQESRLYPYYAGYASSFAEATLRTVRAPSDGLVLDPWNGSGTTTSAAAKLGYKAVGQDLNPVMVLVAKAGLLPATEATSLLPLARAIVDSTLRIEAPAAGDDPLQTWFAPSSASTIRKLEAAVNQALVSRERYTLLTCKSAIDDASSLASLFYVALFRTARQLLSEFVPSNPTWVKKPASLASRKRPTAATINNIFLSEVLLLSGRLINGEKRRADLTPEITLGNAEKLLLMDECVDLVITSPPYCTRIDYAVATSIELAVLRASKLDFDNIRRSLMGTSTVPRNAVNVEGKWGKVCADFLTNVYSHSSKASATYYYKSHIQYFDSLNSSIEELARVLRPRGQAILVVQDSYYKELRNDVASITTEMAENARLSLTFKKDFVASRSMASINGRARKYRSNAVATESVLCFSKI